MKISTKKIVVIVAGILLIGWFCIGILLPRVMIYTAVQEYMPYVDAQVNVFTDFSLSFDKPVQTIDNGFISLNIPADLEREEMDNGSTSIKYVNSNEKTINVYLTEPWNMSAEAFTNDELDVLPCKMKMNRIMDGFEKIGKGQPDNIYNAEKCMLLVDSNDYSFWDINKGASFLLAASSKYALTTMCSEVIIYERDDMRAIMYNVHKKDGTEYLMATVYNANDFDEGCSLLLNLNSIDDVYAVINSIEFTDKTAAAAETIL